ncbi:hypothetical protein [Cytophaga aurantiaca]|uniref:hypothetical protein n=1 Tax=Cytophaga aurantiaca TaxID=29530 RepID=UPI0003791E24|nr:hypothetical protein [Cytophaga aurantiaca]
MSKYLIVNRKINFALFLLIVSTILFSCTDKKEYNMELTFQREMTAQSLYENDRIVIRIEKEIVDNGRRPIEVAILDHVQHITNVRNKYIDSMKRVDVLMENIKPIVQLAANEDKNTLALLNFYQKALEEKNDSLIFQKLINVYLILEKKALNDELIKVSGSCHWGFPAPHVIKTTDTVSAGQSYEFTVVPDRYDHNETYTNDDCQITVFRNDVPVEIKPVINKKGFLYTIAFTPAETGTYKVKGLFTQRSYHHSYVFMNVFTDSFVVK